MKRGDTQSDSRPRRVLITTLQRTDYEQAMAKGVIDYVSRHEPWALVHRTGGLDLSDPGALAGFDGALVAAPRNAAKPFRGHPPVVLMATASRGPSLRIVRPDNKMLSRRALRELLGLGYERFAYVGPKEWWSRTRGISFERECQEKGLACLRLLYARGQGLSEGHVEKLRSQPRPFATLTANLQVAQELLEVASGAGIAVPEEMAILAIGEDELAARLSHPTLSALDHNGNGVGYQAAAILDGIFHGDRPRRRIWEVPPGRMIHRQSTSAFAFEDPEMVLALHWIRDHACEGIKVEDVMDRLTVSRRTLEMRFGKYLRRTVHEEILRVKLARVVELLTETMTPLADIAVATGFQSASDLGKTFKRCMGMAPGAYRKKHGPGATPPRQ